MKAVVCWAPGDLRVEKIDEPSPHAGEVKVAVVAVGVCHTDLNFTSGQVPVPYPIVLGHEAAGVVVECGDGVTAVAVGDHVICSIIGPCEQCFQCLRDDHALCEEAPFFTGTMLDGTTRLSQGDTPIHTLHYQGSYAEYTIVPERFVVRVHDDAPLDVVCGLACGLATGLGAAMVRAEVAPGSSVVVVGAGGVGLATMIGARFRGATTIVAVDRLVSKVEKALAIGVATHAVDASTADPVAAVLELTAGRGADYGFDAAGVPGTLDQVLSATRPGATCVVIGRALGAVTITLDTTALLRQRVLTGTYGGSIHPRRHLPELVDLFMAGRLDLGAILDRRYALDDAPQALDDLHHGPRMTRGVIVVDPEFVGAAEVSGGSISFDEIESREGFLATGEKPGAIDWLPDPPRQPRHVTLISVDDHLVEPPDMFEGRMPAKFADATPRVMTEDDGASEYWLYDGQKHYKVGLNAVVGKPLHQRTFDPARFDEMRRGSYDIHARVHDMDLNGVYASLCFPSSLAGFAGQRYQLGVSDPELARAVVRAANDWQLDVWAGTYPGRIIPLQLPWLLDPEEGAAEIRANAARGFHAVTFPELPERLGLPSLHTGHWDPFLAASAETETVVCLHVGSSSSAPATSSGAPSDTIGVLFFGWAMFSAVDWLYSKVALRFPDLKLCLSEGGIGWVAGLLDRLDHVGRYQAIFGTWEGIDLTPREVMRRNFWFCTIDDIAGLQQRHRIGVDHLLLESDYPHQDGTWPDTQEIVWSQIGGFPRDEIERLAWRNASELFHHPVPQALQLDPDADLQTEG